MAVLRVRRRCDRIRQLMDDRTRTTAAIDRAIGRHLHAARVARLAQPGLFDRPTTPAPQGLPDGVVAEIGPPPTVAVGRVVLVAAIAMAA
jgi:hypothetical protein